MLASGSVDGNARIWSSSGGPIDWVAAPSPAGLEQWQVSVQPVVM